MEKSVRRRERYKEIGPDFYYQPKSTFEQFTDRVVRDRNAPFNMLKNKDILGKNLYDRQGNIRKNLIGNSCLKEQKIYSNQLRL